ncbi:MAG: DUF721 domain-containing protein [Betaproteobacteria bacterium]|nr:DUF721 domain-containing protein [Betaproteobacteria bacterium]
MPLTDIQHLLSGSAELKSVRAKAGKQAALQKAFVDHTPVEFADLSKATRVGYIKAGTLFLLAEHASAAAKLRQLLPRLLPVFRKLEPEVTGIRVVVQVKDRTQKATADPSKKTLPSDSIENFKNLAQAVKDQNLKSAITNLVLRRTK